jgi:hypothetical protein
MPDTNDTNQGHTSVFLNKIDYRFLETKFYYELLVYIFPLIERIIIEILKNSPDADIEIVTQGKYRTLYAVIRNPVNARYFNKSEIEIIEEIYKPDGIRNIVFHSHKTDIKIDSKMICEIKLLANSLIIKLEESVEQINQWNWVNIQKL